MIEQDFLSVIRETEDRAEAMVADAQTEARQRIDETRLEADRRVASARDEAEAMTWQILEHARSQASGKDQEGIAATREQAGEIRAAVAPSMEQAIRIVAERIVK